MEKWLGADKLVTLALERDGMLPANSLLGKKKRKDVHMFPAQ